jgi:hypothetical protein
MRGATWIVWMALAVAACGPVYEPGYRLEPPPASEAAASCLAACAASRDACVAAAAQRLDACEDRATLLKQVCTNNAQLDYLTCSAADRRDGYSCYRRQCPRPVCSRAGLESCGADYRDCFAACGGKVVEEQRCVANCPS